MRDLIFNFFNSSGVLLLSQFCKYFNLNRCDVQKYFTSVNRDDLTASKIVKDFNLNLSLYDSSKVKFICRHMTTATTSGLKSINEKGLLDLKSMLETNTPLSQFLSEHKIFVDVQNKQLKIEDIIYPITSYGEKCTYSMCEKDTICTGYYRCKLREKIDNLGRKLYKYGATVEFFINANLDEIKGYSCVKYHPEILCTLDDICKQANPIKFTGYTLRSKWVKQDLKCYIIEFDATLSEMETYEFHNAVHWFKSYGTCIRKSGYSFEEFLDGVVPKQVFDNIKLISLFISIFFYNSEELGSLLPGKCVAPSNLTINEVDN